MLTWSEVTPPNCACAYDHVVAETPLGTIYLLWKENDSPCGHMPWEDDSFVIGNSLDEAKEAAQLAWDAMTGKMAALSSKGPGDE